MNFFFALVDWSLIGSKLAALLALIFFAKQSVKEMLVGKPTSDWREQVEHSLLIVAIVSFTFHFIGRLSSDAILAANIDDGIRRTIYYFFFVFYEVVYVSCIFCWHKHKKCVVAKYARFVCYLSVVMASLLIIRYADRVIFKSNILDDIYGYMVMSLNIATICLIGAYPAYRLFNFFPNKKWV